MVIEFAQREIDLKAFNLPLRAAEPETPTREAPTVEPPPDSKPDTPVRPATPAPAPDKLPGELPKPCRGPCRF